MDSRRELADAARHRAHRRQDIQDLSGVRESPHRLSRSRPELGGRPTDRLLALYLLLASVPLLWPGRPAGWPFLLVLPCLVVLLAWPPAWLRRLLGAAARHWPRTTRALLDWYPLLLVPVLYTELHSLIQALHGGRFFDPIIQQLELALFRGQPSQDLAAALPFRWLSELLHAGYLSYYFIIYIPPLLLYATGRRWECRRSIFMLMLVFALHYLVFIYFPVQGPRYLFPPPGAPLSEGVLYRLAHWVLATGSSQGAAFPSSHVGVAMVQVLATYRFQRRLAPALAGVALLLALGAVYGGFHYAIDALCGALLGALAVLFAPRVYRLLGGDWERKEPVA